jgi:Glycosyl transferase family 2
VNGPLPPPERPARPVRASVVVLSKDEAGLAETLTHLGEPATTGAAEVIVVDASSGRLDHLAAAHPWVRWIAYQRPPTSRKRVTIPEQRNLGVRAARGGVIVFLDAGCRPGTDWLERLLAPIDAGRAQVVVGGRRNDADSRYGVPQTAEHLVEEAPTLNMALTAEVLARVGPFDEAFSYGSDIDLCWRLGDLGVRILMVPAAEVAVHWGSARRQTTRAWYYGAARARLYRKHPDRLRQLPSRDPILLVYPVFLLGLPVVLLAPWHPLALAYLLLLAVPLWRNRRLDPLLTLADHLVFGAGALAHVARLAR